jgi:predicted RNA-binding Zn-ribbon protein involved in translation (DUF1610 family)
MKQDYTGQWREKAETVITGVHEWRLAHPKATLKEIEQELDQRLAQVRARILGDAAMVSAVEEQAAVCPSCGSEMAWRGEHTRRLVTQHDQEVEIKRQYAVCPKCGVGLFPPG